MMRLDGGAMFGIIPRPLWAPRIPPDDHGRIRLAVRPMLVRVDDRVILVDTGMGSKWSERDVERYGVDQSEHDLLRSLREASVAPEDVTDVVLTHLHFDHAGGTTSRDADGTLQLVFPNARHHLQRRNLQQALRPTSRDRGSYLAESFSPLIGASQLVLHDGPFELAAGVDTIVRDGHTIGLQMVRVRDPAGVDPWLLFTADVLPTSAHLAAAWVMGYDLRPDVSAREKARLVERAVTDKGLLFYEHDPVVVASTVELDDRGRPKVGESFS